MPPGAFDPGHVEARRELRLIGEQAARAGGEVARARFRTDYRVRLKEDRSEVSEADEAAQAAHEAALEFELALARARADALIASAGLARLRGTGR